MLLSWYNSTSIGISRVWIRTTVCVCVWERERDLINIGLYRTIFRITAYTHIISTHFLYPLATITTTKRLEERGSEREGERVCEYDSHSAADVWAFKDFQPIFQLLSKMGSNYFEVLKSWQQIKFLPISIVAAWPCGRVAEWLQPLKNPNPCNP